MSHFRSYFMTDVLFHLRFWNHSILAEWKAALKPLSVRSVTGYCHLSSPVRPLWRGFLQATVLSLGIWLNYSDTWYGSSAIMSFLIHLFPFISRWWWIRSSQLVLRAPLISVWDPTKQATGARRFTQKLIKRMYLERYEWHHEEKKLQIT